MFMDNINYWVWTLKKQSLSNLFLVNEIISNGYFTEILDILNIIVVFCGIAIIITKNPIISVLSLIGLFSGIASYLIILDLSFIGLSYIIIYVGAVSILFLFILMLINIRISELQNNTNNSILLSIIIIIYLHFILFILLPYEITILKKNENDYSLTNLLINNYFNLDIKDNFSTDYGYKSILSGSLDIGVNIISFVSSIAWDVNLAAKGNQITNIGNVMYTNYNLWLILTSLILLLAMVGSIIIVTKSDVLTNTPKPNSS